MSITLNQALTVLRSPALPLCRRDVNTDEIVPARFLRKPRKAGLAPYLFHDLRQSEDGGGEPFPLDLPAYRGARLLIARENFGCGSSREYAVYALADHGFRALVAPSFGDIFHANALKNGVLPIVLPAATVERLLALAQAAPGGLFTVDLPAQTLTAPDGGEHGFAIDAFRKRLLMTGEDELAYTLGLADRIEAFEDERVSRQPWA